MNRTKCIYSLAPLEGVTDPIFLRVYEKYFPYFDRAYIPFLMPETSGKISAAQKKRMDPTTYQGRRWIPQIIGANPDEMIPLMEALAKFGYQEINLNMGCPSNCVVKKGKGSGLLKNVSTLDRFLDRLWNYPAVYQGHWQISIKTRIGFVSPWEFEDIVKVYQRYPLKELIVHPRTKVQGYQGPCHLEVLDAFFSSLPYHVAYNGDLFTTNNIAAIRNRYPFCSHLMLGRGILYTPDLLYQVKTGKRVSQEYLYKFYLELFLNYYEKAKSTQAGLHLMKQMLSYKMQGDACDPFKVKQCKKMLTMTSPWAIIEHLPDLF